MQSKDIVNLKSRLSSNRKTEWYKISSRLLMFLCVLLLGCLFILLLSYNLKWPIVYCETNKCLRSAVSFKLSMNRSVDPCEDFFKFACGRWQHHHPLYPNQKRTSRFSQTENSINFVVQRFLSATHNNDDILPVKQSKLFYQSCLNRKKNAETIGLATVFDYLKRVDLPIIPTIFFNESINYSFDWMKSEAKMKKLIPHHPFIEFSVKINWYNSSQNLMYIRPPQRNCEILKDRRMRFKLKKTLEHIVHHVILEATKNASTVSEESLEDAVSAIEKIYNFICHYKITKVPTGTYQESYKFQELQAEIDHHMSKKINYTHPGFLQSYVGEIFNGVEGVTIDFNKDLLYMRSTSYEAYLLDVLTLIYSTPKVHIELFLWFEMVMFMAPFTYLNTVYKHIINPHIRYTANGLSRRSDELVCAHVVTSFMHFAVAYGVADKNIKSTIGQKVNDMVDLMMEVLRNRIQNADWLDDKTKSVGLEKLEYMKKFIGIPNWLFEKGELEKKYEKVEINETDYLRNRLQILELIATNELKSLSKDNINRELFINPMLVNAFNIATSNSIVIPMAILTFPTSDFGLDVLNFGAFGTILGHELIHEFDAFGIYFDKHGNFGTKWSDKSKNAFFRKTQCFIHQYDNLTVEGLKGRVSGSKTKNENIADAGGLNIAYEAFKKYERFKSEWEKLPGFENYTTGQLFFIAFGGFFCSFSTPADHESRLKHDVHSPGSIRVNVAIQNNMHFAKEFNCPLGSKMNPVKKCRIW